MAIATETDTAYYLPKNPALITLVEQAKTRYPGAADGARIHRAAALVEAGAVSQEGGVWYVLSHGTKYPMGRHICEDIRHEQAPEGRCKHRWAKTLAKALKEKEQSMEGIENPLVWTAWNATTNEDGRAIEDGEHTWFVADGATSPVRYGWHEIVLQRIVEK